MGRLAIIGLGLIGGSVGLALKRAAPVNTTIMGYDQEAEVMGRALKAGVVDEVSRTLEGAVKDASMVIVATPIVSMRRIFRDSRAVFLREGEHPQDAPDRDRAVMTMDVIAHRTERRPRRVCRREQREGLRRCAFWTIGIRDAMPAARRTETPGRRVG